MLLNFKCAIVIFPLFLTTPAYAGNGVANGGNTIVCRDSSGKILSAQLLDLYEIDYKYEDEIKGDDTKADAFEVAKERLKDLSVIHPKLYEQFSKRINEFKDEFDFKSDVKLTQINDSHHLFRPIQPKCKVTQVALRRLNILDSEKRFIVDKNIWEHMKLQSKVGLILHELIYEYFSKLGEDDSRKARLYNGKLLVGEMKAMTKAQYWDFIKKMKIPIYP